MVDGCDIITSEAPICFSTWATLKPSDIREGVPEDFARKLLEKAPSIAREEDVDQIQAVFKLRGLNIANH